MKNNWNKKNILWMLLYTVLYAIATILVVMTGMIHPIFFVCYQITAGILLSGIILRAFYRIKAPGVAVFFSAAMILVLLFIQDAIAWHVIPLIAIALLAEVSRTVSKYQRIGELIGTVFMSFSTFGYYGQIWFNRDYSYQVAMEDMPAGYADTLMSVSPLWALVVVLIIGIILSIIIANTTARLFKLEK